MLVKVVMNNGNYHLLKLGWSLGASSVESRSVTCQLGFSSKDLKSDPHKLADRWECLEEVKGR